MSRNFKAYTSIGFLISELGDKLVINSVVTKSRNLNYDCVVEFGKGIIGSAVNKPAGFITGNLKSYTGDLEYYSSQENINSMMIMRVMDNQSKRIQGLLLVDSENVRAFNDEHKELMYRFTQIASAMITSAKLTYQMNRYAIQADTQYEIAKKLSEALKPEEVIDTLTQSVMKTFEHNRVVICAYNPATTKGTIWRIMGDPGSISEGMEFDIHSDRSLYGSVFRNRRAMVTQGFRLEKRFVRFDREEPRRGEAPGHPHRPHPRRPPGRLGGGGHRVQPRRRLLPARAAAAQDHHGQRDHGPDQGPHVYRDGEAGHHRRAHANRQPPQVPGHHDHGAGAFQPLQHAHDPAAHGHRPFQEVQRHLRPPGRRPGAADGGQGPAGLHPQHGLLRPLRRRGVRGGAHPGRRGPGPHPGRAHPQIGGVPADPERGQDPARDRVHRQRHLPLRRRPPSRRSSTTPTRRCTSASRAAATASRTFPRCARPRPPQWPSPPAIEPGPPDRRNPSVAPGIFPAVRTLYLALHDPPPPAARRFDGTRRLLPVRSRPRTRGWRRGESPHRVFRGRHGPLPGLPRAHPVRVHWRPRRYSPAAARACGWR